MKPGWLHNALHDRDAMNVAPAVSRTAPWRWMLLLAVLTILVYARTFSAGFLSLDDGTNIVDNPHINPPTLAGLRTIWTETYFGQYVPLSYTLWGAESWLAGHTASDGTRTLDPRLFHVTNVLLHAVCVVLVFAVLRHLVRDNIAAFLGALLFAWHPLQVESVGWIAETRNTLAGAFSLGSILAYLRFRGNAAEDATSTTPDEPTNASPRWGYYALALVCYLLALVSKPAAVSVPLILVALDILWYRSVWWRSLALFAGWFVPAVAIAAATSSSQAEGIDVFVFVPPWWQRPFVAGDSFAFYLGKLLWPAGLIFDYGRTPQVVLASGWTYVVWIVPVAVVALLAWLPGRRVWLTAAAIFLLVALPVSGLIPRAAQSLTTVSDHYIYLGMLGPALALAWVVMKRPFLRGEVLLVLALLALLSLRQTGYWHDDRTLALRTLEYYPRSVTSMYVLYRNDLAQGNLADAEEWILRAAEVDPHKPILLWEGNSLLAEVANFYLAQGREIEATRTLEQVVAAQPDNLEARLLLCDTLMRQSDYVRVVEAAQALLALRADVVQVRAQLAAALVALNRHDEAIEHWRHLLSVDPQNADLHALLGRSYVQVGDLTSARAEFERVLELRPGDAVATDVLRQIEARTRGTSAPHGK